MLDIDERREAATLLRLRNYRQGQRRLPRRFRSVNLDNTAARKAPDAQRAINQNIPCRNNLDVDDLVVAETHDGAVAIVFCDLLNREVEVLVTRGDELVFA